MRNKRVAHMYKEVIDDSEGKHQTLVVTLLIRESPADEILHREASNRWEVEQV